MSSAERATLKDRLDKAVTTGCPEKIIEEAKYGLRMFRFHGYPADWHLWERARDTALEQLQMDLNHRVVIL